jgi:adenylate cyclase
MRAGITLRKNLGTLVIVVSIWVLSNMFISWVIWESGTDVPGRPTLGRRLLYAAASGLAIGIFNTVVELFVLRRQLRRWPTVFIIMVRTGLLLFFVAAVSASAYGIYTYSKDVPFSLQGLSRVMDTEYGESGIIAAGFTILVSLITNFVWQISRTLSPERFYSYITGRYHRPREVFRVVMFLDIKSSTSIAERLGNVRYHEFLNEFFYDLDEVIARHEGEIYQYVGDEVIIVWKKEYARYKGYAVRSFFRCRRRIHGLSAKYERKYGFVPEFRASLHCGHVVVGEVGDTKKEIVFHGDVINTGSRILDQCKPVGADFLLTRDVLESLRRAKGDALNWDKYRIESRGHMKLRGKETELEVFSVEEKAPADR